MRAGVLALQGAVSEHIRAFEASFEKLKIEGVAVPVKKNEQLEEVDVLAFPGGESTTMSRLLDKNCMRKPLISRWKEG
ncbi:MAG TPA: pyridoxal 5'-phosphate synthase glutaminase subunit PdxT, partial [Euryarchaeota archaeon]|nr:pyridoxal 5'-phosphate synthase glutaminase subunit PdxT [Euryarchaeota archaeon]